MSIHSRWLQIDNNNFPTIFLALERQVAAWHNLKARAKNEQIIFGKK
jgi:hypothetical protein